MSFRMKLFDILKWNLAKCIENQSIKYNRNSEPFNEDESQYILYLCAKYKCKTIFDVERYIDKLRWNQKCEMYILLRRCEFYYSDGRA